jgi:hypothetical protein
VPTFEQIKNNLKNLSIIIANGGKSFTELNSKCEVGELPFKRIAFVIPYRDRLSSLHVWLNNMHPFLTRQKIDYGIYLIEPIENLEFNRALLMNIGFIEAFLDMIPPEMFNSTSNKTTNSSDVDLGVYLAKESYWDCFIFHDVDM